MMDQATTLGELRAAVQQFVSARDWDQYHTVKNLAMSIAIEAAEIMEHFQWQGRQDSMQDLADPATHAAVADELADVIIYCLSFANSAKIDVSDAVYKKLARNELRFPIGQVRGRLGDEG